MESKNAEYCCPGEARPISRSVHLGRMARFYPGCRLCAHRDDTGTLSPKHVKRLVEVRTRAQRPAIFHDEGAAGVFVNEVSPDVTRRLAAAFGITLRQEHQAEADSPAIVTATDGRAIMPELVAAVSEGLRWAGCNVVDVGEATSPCVAFGIGQLGADGGVLLGNPTPLPHMVGLKFWVSGGRPLSRGDGLDAVEEAFLSGVDRPGRKYGELRRLQVDGAYLDRLAEHYHALRPLRFAMLATCRPVVDGVRRLTEPVDCHMLLCHTTAERMPEQILTEKAHFGVQIADDGETAQFWDEQGSFIPAARLFCLIERYLEDKRGTGSFCRRPRPTLRVGARCFAQKVPVPFSSSCRAEMYRAMASEGAILGSGPSGRFWYAVDRQPLADALMTLTLLLEILSQSDRPLSRVLDLDAPIA